MEGIHYVFIDIDNTLLDFDAAVKESFIVGFEKFGLGKFEDWMFETFTRENIKLWEALERKEITLDQLRKVRYQIVFKALGIDFDSSTFEAFFRSFIHESVIPVTGAVSLLETLSKKYILCAASNGPYEQQMHRLELSNMGRYFKYVFISEDVGHAKPSKEFFDVALNRMGNPSLEECLIIGDSLTSDISGGINIGMKTIYFNKHKKENHSETHPDYSFDSLKEIEDFLK